jgi:hypothetical protein
MIALIRNAPKHGNLFMVRFCDNSTEAMEHMQSGDYIVKDVDSDLRRFDEEAIMYWARTVIETDEAQRV